MAQIDDRLSCNQVKLAITGVCWGLAKLLKFSLVVGSKQAFFSAANVCTPFMTVFGGVGGGLVGMLLAGLGNISVGWMPLRTGLPAMFAGLYWNSSDRRVRVGVPLVCMSWFWFQTGLTVAAMYPLLWLVPVAVGIFGPNHIYLRALGATFTAHAVGSVIYLYCVPLAPEQWFALIPVVALERIILAIGMVWFYQAAENLVFWLARIKTLLASCKKALC